MLTERLAYEEPATKNSTFRIRDREDKPTYNSFKSIIKRCIHDLQVGGQAVLGRQPSWSTPWLTKRHGYDPTCFGIGVAVLVLLCMEVIPIQVEAKRS